MEETNTPKEQEAGSWYKQIRIPWRKVAVGTVVVFGTAAVFAALRGGSDITETLSES